MKSVCFIGHRKIERTTELEDSIFQLVEKLILCDNVDTFLFGSRSQFNDLCYEIVSELKSKYLNIKRVYVRAEYQYVDDKEKEKYFLNGYEDSYLPNSCKIASKASYIQRNYDMIRNSDYCIFYYDEKIFIKEKTSLKKSGTHLAYIYAVKNRKTIFNIKKN